jgi:hypothetical protein
MAKLSGPLSFEGKLDDISAYKMKGLLASKGCPSSELKLSLSGTLPAEGFSLLIAVGVEVGTPSMGEMVLLRYNGCGKIVGGEVTSSVGS